MDLHPMKPRSSRFNARMQDTWGPDPFDVPSQAKAVGTEVPRASNFQKPVTYSFKYMDVVLQF
jgi:hypothetical protein